MDDIEDPNAINGLYNTYREMFRDTYVIQSEDGLEKNAFASGVIAALSMLDMEPDDVVSDTTGRSVLQDAEEVLVEKATTQ